MIVDLFQQHFQSTLGKQRLDEIRREVEALQDQEIVKLDKNEFLKDIVSRYSLDEVSVSGEPREVEEFTRSYQEQGMLGDTINKTRLSPVFVFEYEGQPDLFKYKGDFARGMGQSSSADFGDDSFRIELHLLNTVPAAMVNELKALKENIQVNVKGLNQNIAEYNGKIEDHAHIFYQKRIEEAQNNANLINAFGVPVKVKTSIPQTNRVPTPKFVKSITVTKRKNAELSTDPTLPSDVYEDILQTIFDVGKVMERLPKIYIGKDEETLRDMLLLYLEPRYEYVGGETFNMDGKTDILMRYENNNIFVAECKFWEGEKAYSVAIDQLFSYLAWRDAKTSLIIFSRRKDHSSVVQKIKKATEKHPNFVKIDSEADEDGTWLNFVMHYPGDIKKLVYMSVLIFHFPRDPKETNK